MNIDFCLSLLCISVILWMPAWARCAAATHSCPPHMLASGTMCLCLLPVCALTSAYHRSPPLTTAHHLIPPLTTAHHRSPLLATAHHCSPLLATARHCSPLLTTGPLPHSGDDACVQCLDAPLTSAAHSNLLFAHISVWNLHSLCCNFSYCCIVLDQSPDLQLEKNLHV